MEPGEITRLLCLLKAGNREAEAELVPLVYKELRLRAARHMQRESPDHTLQPTALVHETYLRLIRQQKVDWQSRNHFFALAAKTMRRILVDHARTRLATKRAGNLQKVPLDEIYAVSKSRPDEFLALDEALDRLSAMHPRQGQVVELRFFGGLTEADIADVLGVAEKTVKRDWSAARAWLRGQLGEAAP